MVNRSDITHKWVKGEAVPLSNEEIEEIYARQVISEARIAAAPVPRDLGAELDAAVARADRLEAVLKVKKFINNTDIA